MRFILLALVVVAIVAYVLRDKKLKSHQDEGDGASQGDEDMAECPVCGTFVSPSEGVIYQGACYCSKECFKKGK